MNLFKKILLGLSVVAAGGAVAYKFGLFDGIGADDGTELDADVYAEGGTPVDSVDVVESGDAPAEQ